MAFLLSRYVRNDVSLQTFCEGFDDFIKCSIKDPQNNIGELDKSMTSMLETKILNAHNPREGLMFVNASIASQILMHPFLIQLLFYPRVFQKKHGWPTAYLSV